MSTDADTFQLNEYLSPAEEIANSVTHGLGLVLSLAGAAALMLTVFATGDVVRIAGCAAYATTLVAVYACSTLSHCIKDAVRRRQFRVLDQAFIYLLIVGTYTPFALAFLPAGAWWAFLGVMWAIAFCGFFSKILFAYRINVVAVSTYLALGWMPIISTPALLNVMPAQAMWWVLIGGLFYTVGTIFLVYDKHVTHFHAVWHLFVIVGSAWHFYAILFFVGTSA